MWIVPGTAFAPQSSTIGNAGLPVLDSVVAVLKASPRTTAEITGHADEAANRTANNQLALARADAVRSYLVRNGVRPQQLQARGVGAGIANPTGAMPQNRQTEIRITTP
jgi:OOP family OmpA-OmpF porin